MPDLTPNWERSPNSKDWPGCLFCKHLTTTEDDALVCGPFPDGIPNAIVGGSIDHMQVRPGQEGTTIFEPYPDGSTFLDHLPPETPQKTLGSSSGGGFLVPDAMTAMSDLTSSATLWIGFWLPSGVAKALSIPGGESPEELHMTIVHSKIDSDMLREMNPTILSFVQSLAATQPPLLCVVTGLGRFQASESSRTMDVIHAAVNVPGLNVLRAKLVNGLTGQGIPISSNFAYAPHITLAYIAPNAPMPIDQVPNVEFQANALIVDLDNVRFSFPLTG